MMILGASPSIVMGIFLSRVEDLTPIFPIIGHGK